MAPTTVYRNITILHGMTKTESRWQTMVQLDTNSPTPNDYNRDSGICLYRLARLINEDDYYYYYDGISGGGDYDCDSDSLAITGITSAATTTTMPITKH